MFSSIASFLPSVLQSNGNDNHTTTTPPAPSNPTTNPETIREYKQPVEDDIGAKKGATSKAKSVNETFIVVRPPPAKSNHPLNLQVQLVPPTPRAVRRSFDDDTASTTTSLTRTASNRSDTSTYGSTISFSSTASTASGRRTIIPLYNLHAHNVLTNTIVDAGTDAKIARFQKRGIELIDLAILEPVEVWGEIGRGKSSRSATPEYAPTADSSAISLQYHPFQPPSQPPSAQPDLPPKRNNIFGKLFKKSSKDSTPPASPHASVFSTNSPTPTQPSVTPTPARIGTARGHARNLSSTLSPPSIPIKFRTRSSSPTPPQVGLGPNILEDRTSVHSSSTADHSNSGVNPNPNPSDEKVLRPPILGIQPILSYAYTPSSAISPGPITASSLSKNARALMYVWFVRKWLKRKDRSSFMGNILDEEGNGGVLGMMRGSAKSQGSLLASGVVSEGVEVRFEWRRVGGKAKTRRGRLGPRRSRGSLFVPDGDGEEGERTEGEQNGNGIRERDMEAERKQANRLSVISHHSISTNMSISEEGSPRREKNERHQARGGSKTRDRERRMSRDGRAKERDLDVEDAGDDSDPEDSETPWVCTLKIRKAGMGSTAATASSRLRPPQGDGEWSPGGWGTIPPRTADGREELGVFPSSPQSQVLRVKVGTLSPTPHHPKVVGMLKVPFPLPDIEVERMVMTKRSMGQPPPQSQWGGTTLTAEEIKDVVCSTALWLVVRESFGGIGKVTRRGDGWRIRA